MSTQMHSVRSKLKDLISQGLEAQYVSKSCKDSVLTGNHYQSIKLDEEYTSGFRTPRTDLLDQVDVSGIRVLDLGSNLGEISRYARSRGAVLVDGYEYDQHFIDLANMINAYERVSRVSFFRRDITDADVYRDRYDLVLVLSVFTYIEPMLHAIAKVTDCLLLETHKLDGNLQRDYISPVSDFFPVHYLLGTSEWGTNQDSSVRRSVILFAKDENHLQARIRNAQIDAGERAV